MKKLLIVLALVGLAGSAEAQLLWRISGKDMERPSYVFGTHHLAPMSVVDSIPAMEEAVAGTEQVYGEVDMLEMQRSMQQLAAAMMLPEGTTMASLLSPKKFEQVDSVLKVYVGVGLDNPAMVRMKPAALTTQLAVAVAARTIPGYNPAQQLDQTFQTEALKAGKAVGGLETLQDQLDVLVGGELDRQVELLLCTVGDIGRQAELSADLTAAYMRQRLDEIETLMTAKTGCDSTPEEDEKLLYGRNDAWMERIPGIMAEKPTLFVVGVAHLAGGRGLLAQLERLGYTVEGLK